MFSFINSESFISITMTDPVPSVLIWAITVGNHAPLIQTVDAIRWNSYISVKAGAGASLRLRLRNTVFLQYEYIKCTQYTYPLLLSDGCRKGSGRHLPRHTDCLTEPVIQLTAFIIKSIVSTSAVFTHALCATLTQCELFPLCIYLYKPVRKPCLHWWSNLLSAHLLFLNIIMF